MTRWFDLVQTITVKVVGLHICTLWMRRQAPDFSQDPLRNLLKCTRETRQASVLSHAKLDSCILMLMSLETNCDGITDPPSLFHVDGSLPRGN